MWFKFTHNNRNRWVNSDNIIRITEQIDNLSVAVLGLTLDCIEGKTEFVSDPSEVKQITQYLDNVRSVEYGRG